VSLRDANGVRFNDRTTPEGICPLGGWRSRYKAYLSPGANYSWQVTRWLSYGGASAKAIATNLNNNCVPSCAQARHEYAVTTIVFTGRVPCDGVSGYARYRVVKTSNAAAAPVGFTYPLSWFCGYPAYTPSLPCLSQHNRAASLAAQTRCYITAIRAANTRIAKTERSLSTEIYDNAKTDSSLNHENLEAFHPERAHRLDNRVARAKQATFTAGEHSWGVYRKRFCTANYISPGFGDSAILYDACVYRLDDSHLRELTFQTSGS
jgi:hypothetical protein